MEISVKKAIEVFNNASVFASKNEKFDYAVKKLGKKLQPGFDKFNDKLEEARIDHCSTDEKNNILRDSKNNYIYTKDNLKALNKKVAVLQEEVIQFEPYFAVELPEGLTEEQIELFTGILIKPEDTHHE